MDQRILSAETITAFKDFLRREDKSENTTEKYIRDVNSFFAFAKPTATTVGDDAHIVPPIDPQTDSNNRAGACLPPPNDPQISGNSVGANCVRPPSVSQTHGDSVGNGLARSAKHPDNSIKSNRSVRWFDESGLCIPFCDFFQRNGQARSLRSAGERRFAKRIAKPTATNRRDEGEFQA